MLAQLTISRSSRKSKEMITVKGMTEFEDLDFFGEFREENWKADVYHEWNGAPMLFKQRSDINTVLLWNCVSEDSEDSCITYLVSEVDDETITELEKNKLTVRDAITGGQDQWLVQIGPAGIRAAWLLDEDEEIPDELLPAANIPLYYQN